MDYLPGNTLLPSEEHESTSLTSLLLSLDRPAIILASNEVNDQNLFINGLTQNIVVLYHLFESLGYDSYLLQHSITTSDKKAFLKNYTIPFVQLDPMKSILVFSHNHNTFDKRKLLENKHPDFFKESTKTVDMFIKSIYEQDIKDFFMNRIDGLLEKYEPGDPKMKPDVLKQIKEIDEQRKKMMEEQQMQNTSMPQIIMERPGEAPRAMTGAEIVDALRNHQQMNQLLQKRVKELEAMVHGLQQQLIKSRV